MVPQAEAADAVSRNYHTDNPLYAALSRSLNSPRPAPSVPEPASGHHENYKEITMKYLDQKHAVYDLT